MRITLREIENTIREFAAIINAPKEFIPTFGSSNQTGLPHIEIHEGQYIIIVCENGVELTRESFEDPDALVFKVLEDISFSMACDLVYKDTSDQNFRERFLAIQQNFLSKINRYAKYKENEKLQQDTITTKKTRALSEYRKKRLLKRKTHKTAS